MSRVFQNRFKTAHQISQQIASEEIAEQKHMGSAAFFSPSNLDSSQATLNLKNEMEPTPKSMSAREWPLYFLVPFLSSNSYAKVEPEEPAKSVNFQYR